MYPSRLTRRYVPVASPGIETHKKTERTLYALSWVLTILILLTSLRGYMIPGFYDKETLQWFIQCYSQDIANLFVAPFLLLTSLFAFRGNRSAHLLWGGALFYLIYTFLIYCFSVHFNLLFFFYCLNLGLSVFCFLGFLYTLTRKQVDYDPGGSKVFLISGIYLVVIGVVFYVLWLSSVLPAVMNDYVPADLKDMGITTNPVHVIDLSVCLPGLILTGILLLCRHFMGIWIAPVMLVFCILMEFTIALLNEVTNMQGIWTSDILTWIMGSIAVFTTGMLVIYMKELDAETFLY